jgi:DNA polymerase-4
VVSVRFETRGTGPGVMRTFPADNPELLKADPVDSLAWGDYLDDPARSAPPADDVDHG